MGTNYYHRTNICEHCGHYDQHHIGKSSAGWTFSFHGEKDPDPETNPLGGVVESYADWLERLKAGGKIFNEYEEEVTLPEFMLTVDRKRDEPNNHTDAMQTSDSARNWHDAEGHSFSEGEFS